MAQSQNDKKIKPILKILMKTKLIIISLTIIAIVVYIKTRETNTIKEPEPVVIAPKHEPTPVVIAPTPPTPVEAVKPEVFNPIGKSESDIVTKFGNPISRLDIGAETTLMYESVSYVLEDGVVTSTKAGTKSWEIAAQHTEQPKELVQSQVSRREDNSYEMERRAKEMQMAKLQQRLEQYKSTHNGKFVRNSSLTRYTEEVEKMESEIRKIKNSL